MNVCTCSTGGGNTGLPSCFALFDVTKQGILLEYYKADGSINGIPLAGLTGLDQTFLDGKLKAFSPKERWYITPEMKNITDERSDDITEEFEDSTSVFIQEGARAFSGNIVGADPVWLGQMQSWKCLTAGIYLVDKAGNLIGSISKDGTQLNPIRIQDESLSVKLMKGTDTTKQKVMINFIVSQLENDADLRMIEASKISGVLLGASGLIDVKSKEVTNQALGGFTTKLATNYGGVLSPVYAEGYEVGDFDAFNVTTSAAVPLTSVTESTTVDGQYDFVFADQNSGDVIKVSNKANQVLSKGYDLTSFEVTLP